MSCSEDEIQKQTRVLDLKFPSATEPNRGTSNDFEYYTVEIKSIEPLVIISNDLTVGKAIDQVTGKLCSVIVQKLNVDLKRISNLQSSVA